MVGVRAQQHGQQLQRDDPDEQERRDRPAADVESEGYEPVERVQVPRLVLGRKPRRAHVARQADEVVCAEVPVRLQESSDSEYVET